MRNTTGLTRQCAPPVCETKYQEHNVLLPWERTCHFLFQAIFLHSIAAFLSRPIPRRQGNALQAGYSQRRGRVGEYLQSQAPLSRGTLSLPLARWAMTLSLRPHCELLTPTVASLCLVCLVTPRVFSHCLSCVFLSAGPNAQQVTSSLIGDVASQQWDVCSPGAQDSLFRHS